MSRKLSELLDEYFSLNLSIRSEQTRKIYRYSIKNLQDTVGHPPTLDDLTDDNITKMLSQMSRNGSAARTANERRSRLHAFWSWLAKRGWLDRWPTTPPLRVPQKIPTAWTRAQLVRLVGACRDIQGKVGPIPASLWWESLHLAIWDSGERISGLLSAKWSDFSPPWLVIQAEGRKGGSADACYELRDGTCELIGSMREYTLGTKIWPWPLDKNYLWKRYRNIRKAAGISDDSIHSFHCMRRSFASHLEAAGGDATKTFGHSNRSVTKRYLDPRIVSERPAKSILFDIVDPDSQKSP